MNAATPPITLTNSATIGMQHWWFPQANRTPSKKQSEASMTLVLFVASLSHWALSQPLELAQHTALMSVYDGLGSCSKCVNLPWRSDAFSVFFFVVRLSLQDAIPMFARDSFRRPIVLAQC